MVGAMVESPAVELCGVRKEYLSGEQRVLALDGIDLQIRPRSFVVVEGPSGSGKSTLLHLMGCIDRPTVGEVRIDGQDVGVLGETERARLRSQRLGFVFQSHHLIPVLSARENVEYPLRIRKVGKREARQRAGELLDALGLRDEADRRPAELSGGQCQRVAIARALVGEPALVIADEPTANLDSQTGAEIIELMHTMIGRLGTAFVIATHDPEMAARAEVRHRLHDGRIEP